MSKYKELVELLEDVGVLQDDSEWAVSVQELIKSHRKIAAPAEDVRAVVDEPVAWTSTNTIGFLDSRRSEAHTAWRLNLSTHPLKSDDIALYRRPQRPVVLPERKRDSCEDSDVLTDAQAEGWNACLDEVERLNK